MQSARRESPRQKKKGADAPFLAHRRQKPASKPALRLALVDHHVVQIPAKGTAAAVVAQFEPKLDLVVGGRVRCEVDDRATPRAADRTPVAAREGRLASHGVVVALRGGRQRGVVRVVDEVGSVHELPRSTVHADLDVAPVKASLGCDPVIERQPRSRHVGRNRDVRAIKTLHASLVPARRASADVGVAAKIAYPARVGGKWVTTPQSRGVKSLVLPA